MSTGSQDYKTGIPKPFFTAEDFQFIEVQDWSGIKMRELKVTQAVQYLIAEKANAKVAPLLEENERLKATLKKITQMDRTMMIHQVAEEALGD